jgi:hypothetical protein
MAARRLFDVHAGRTPTLAPVLAAIAILVSAVIGELVLANCLPEPPPTTADADPYGTDRNTREVPISLQALALRKPLRAWRWM